MDNLKSTKSKTKIVHEGYIYVKQKNLANGVISYECELRKNGKHNSGQCKAKTKVLCWDIVGYVNEHTHAPVLGRLMDGTFKIVPELFFQLYTIHALCGSPDVIPLFS